MRLLMTNVLQALARFAKSLCAALVILLMVSVFTPVVFIVLGLVMFLCYPFDKKEITCFFLRMAEEIPPLFREVSDPESDW